MDDHKADVCQTEDAAFQTLDACEAEALEPDDHQIVLNVQTFLVFTLKTYQRTVAEERNRAGFFDVVA